jgi:hypothetical protein
MCMSSTTSVTPGRANMGSVTIVASLASTRMESISKENPRAKMKCSVRPRGVSASCLRARRCSRLKRDAEHVEGLLRRVTDHLITEFWFAARTARSRCTVHRSGVALLLQGGNSSGTARPRGWIAGSRGLPAPGRGTTRFTVVETVTGTFSTAVGYYHQKCGAALVSTAQPRGRQVPHLGGFTARGRRSRGHAKLGDSEPWGWIGRRGKPRKNGP